MPARLIVDDISAYRASARRVMEFLRNRPVSYILGGHIEEDRTGRLYDWMASYHPDEHALQLGKDAELDLPAALDGFNGFQSERDGFVIIDSMHELEAMGTAVLVCLAALGYGVYRGVRWIKRRRNSP